VLYGSIKGHSTSGSQSWNQYNPSIAGTGETGDHFVLTLVAYPSNHFTLKVDLAGDRSAVFSRSPVGINSLTDSDPDRDDIFAAGTLATRLQKRMAAQRSRAGVGLALAAVTA